VIRSEEDVVILHGNYEYFLNSHFFCCSFSL